MSEDDFEPVDESDTPAEIADAVLAALAARPVAQPDGGAVADALEDAAIVCERRDEFGHTHRGTAAGVRAIARAIARMESDTNVGESPSGFALVPLEAFNDVVAASAQATQAASLPAATRCPICHVNFPCQHSLTTTTAGWTTTQAITVAEPLTEERIAELNRAAQDQGVSGIAPSLHLARAIEAAHGIVAPQPPKD